MTDTTATVCPRCGATIDLDPRYVQWCRACGWNVDPTPHPPPSRWQRMLTRFSKRLASRAFDDVVRGGATRSAMLLFATIFAASVIHLLTLALLVGGVALIVVHTALAYALQVIAAAICLLVFLAVQPVALRLRRRGMQPCRVTRDAAPTLFGLLDEISAVIDATAPKAVIAGPFYGASYQAGPGLPPPSVRIGLALWAGLDWPERVALLAHELGHRVNGDLRRSRYVGSAVVTLHRWAALLAPTLLRSSWLRPSGIWISPLSSSLGSLQSLVELLLPVLLLPLSLLVGAIGWTLGTLAARQGQRAEYRADLLAARVAGSEAMLRLLGTFASAPAVLNMLRRQIRYGQAGDPWPALARYFAEVPDSERERLRRLGLQQGARIDSYHPPTDLRAELIRQSEAQPTRVAVDAGRGAAIDRELSPAHQAVAARLTSDLGA